MTDILISMYDISILIDELKSSIRGDVITDIKDRKLYSRDTSLFSITPEIVVFPKDARDVSHAVQIINKAKQSGADVSITARSAGTDMTGGPLTASVSLVFTKYMTHIFDVSKDSASAEPGTYYRDFEKETMKKGVLLPSYPASREICAMGGIIANDAGGEMTLRYGQTHRYVEELDIILSDGSHIITKALNEEELAAKKELQTLEGEIYRSVHALIENNKEIIANAMPQVSKNSAGYALWRVVDKQKRTFDLSQLIVGSQGTLGIITKSRVKLIKPKSHKSMLVVFLSDLKVLPEIVRRILTLDPESFESYDDKTFKLAMRFFPQMASQMGLRKIFKLGFAFLPEVKMVLTGGVPKLVLMAEFAENSNELADKKVRAANDALKDLKVGTRIAPRGIQREKYWTIRRESFTLLRKNVQGLYAAPFIDDIVVPPDTYTTFLPKLNSLLAEYKLLYTIAGHIGDGNLHIIPLVDLSKPETPDMIMELTKRVYKLVIAHGGSITGEHNDGIIRTPYLPLMFGTHMTKLFSEIKKIFDPLNILNPGKKVGGTESDIKKYLIHHS